MKTYLLIMIFYVNSGSTVNTAEFTTLENCRHARKVLYAESARIDGRLETAFCVLK